jgi:hypothetical protein
MPYKPDLYTTRNSTVSTSVHELVINTWCDSRTVLLDRAEGKRLLLRYIYVSIYIPTLNASSLKVQSVNAVYENHRCLFREYGETINTLCGKKANFLVNVKQLVKISVVDEMFAFLGDTLR